MVTVKDMIYNYILYLGQRCETVTKRVGNTVTQQTTCY